MKKTKKRNISADATQEIKTIKTTKRKKKPVSAKVLWMIALLAIVIFTEVFCFMPMFPMKWKLGVIAVFAVIAALLAYFSFTAKRKNMAVRYINAILAVILFAGSGILPYYKGRVSTIIEENQISSGTVPVNLYVMSEVYKAKHPEIEWKETPVLEKDADEIDILNAYKEASFVTASSSDRIYLKPAQEKVFDAVGEIHQEDKSSLIEAADALYTGKADVMFMTETLAYTIRDMEKYKEWDDDIRILCTVYVDEVEQEVVINNAELTKETFSIFFGGNDQTGDLNLTGRTDVCMIVTVNPISHQIVISSFPRDSYVPNPALGWQPDKLTHLGMNGITNTLEGLSDVLQTNIDNYILINFSTYMKIIDALGGVDVENPYEFTYTWDEDYVYPEGTIHLDGQAALYYVRERYSLPDGDFGRNMHQQLVMQAIIRKVSSPAVIANFNNLLDALEGTFLTNLSDSSIYGFCQYQLQENISWNVVMNRAVGAVDMAICASSPSQELSVVLPYKNQIEYMVEVIDKVEAGELIEQEEMPDGYGYMYSPIYGGYSEDDDEPEETPESTPAPEVTEEPVYTPEPSEEPEVTPEPSEEPEVTPEPSEEPEEPQEPDTPEESGGEEPVSEDGGEE